LETYIPPFHPNAMFIIVTEMQFLEKTITETFFKFSSLI
jgi:hypothetical protein